MLEGSQAAYMQALPDQAVQCRCGKLATCRAQELDGKVEQCCRIVEGRSLRRLQSKRSLFAVADRHISVCVSTHTFPEEPLDDVTIDFARHWMMTVLVHMSVELCELRP